MEKFKQITREELKKKMDAKEDFILIDTLGDMSYRRSHLPGAISIDAHQENFVDEVEKTVPDKNKEVIVYCASFSCQLSPYAAGKLADAGYTRVLDFKGGLKDWGEGGYTFEGEGAEEFAESLRKK